MSASVLNYAADQRLLHMLGGDHLDSSHKESKGDCCKLPGPSPGQEAQVSQTSSQKNNFTQTQEKNEAIHRNPAQLGVIFTQLYLGLRKLPPASFA